MWPRRRPVPRVYSDTAQVRDPGLSLVLDDPTPPDSEEMVWQLAEKRGGELAMWKRTAEERAADLVEQCRANHGLRAENARLRSKLAEAQSALAYERGLGSDASDVIKATGPWRRYMDLQRSPQAWSKAERDLATAIDARTSRLADGGTPP